MGILPTGSKVLEILKRMLTNSEDIKLNKLVAEVLGIDVYEYDNDGVGPVHLRKGKKYEYGQATWNPCNSINNAWPVLLENKITLIACRDGWLAVPPDTSVEGWVGDPINDIFYAEGVFDENPLRAGMILFLKMKEKL